MNKTLIQLENWNKNLSDELKWQKYRKMSQSEYIFFRGTNHLFWQFATQKINTNRFAIPNAITWIQGDLHAFNFGTYRNDKGVLVYDINDFDEACQTYFYFDLLRMSISIVLIAYENNFNKDRTAVFVDEYLNYYFKSLRKFFEQREEPEPITRKNAYGKLDEHLKQTEKRKSREKQLKEWTMAQGAKRFFDFDHPKIVAVDNKLHQQITEVFTLYARKLYDKKKFPENYFDIWDIGARITSGTGSYGLPRYYILIAGTGKEYGQRILDMKFQPDATASFYLQNRVFSFANNGERYVQAYKAMAKDTDDHLGYILLDGKAFSIHERSPYKSYFPSKLLNTSKRFVKLCKQWAYITAAAHFRAKKDFATQKILEKAYRSELIANLSQWTFEYVQYNQAVFKRFLDYIYINE